MNESKALSMIGLAQRAHAVVSGSFSVEQAIRSGKAYLVIIASDASENSFEDLSHITFHYGTELVRFSTKDALGHAIGKKERMCLAVTDPGLAASIRTHITSTDEK